MSTPSKDQLDTMDYAYLGTPFVNVQTKDNQNTNSLDFAYLGLPFVGAFNAGTTYNVTQFMIMF